MNYQINMLIVWYLYIFMIGIFNDIYYTHELSSSGCSNISLLWICTFMFDMDSLCGHFVQKVVSFNPLKVFSVPVYVAVLEIPPHASVKTYGRVFIVRIVYFQFQRSRFQGQWKRTRCVSCYQVENPAHANLFASEHKLIGCNYFMLTPWKRLSIAAGTQNNTNASFLFRRGRKKCQEAIKCSGSWITSPRHCF